LIRDGVTIATSMADVAEILDWAPIFAGQTSTANGTDAAPTADPLLALMTGPAADVDELSARSGLPASEVAAHLTMLELRGLVERRAGGSFAAVSIRGAKNDART
jgi:predicted Rossmann fold nucleotide-binding protein DprA/Smf involved in DNA uptake